MGDKKTKIQIAIVAVLFVAAALAFFWPRSGTNTIPPDIQAAAAEGEKAYQDEVAKNAPANEPPPAPPTFTRKAQPAN